MIPSGNSLDLSFISPLVSIVCHFLHKVPFNPILMLLLLMWIQIRENGLDLVRHN
jgi:hypothetical protein